MKNHIIGHSRTWSRAPDYAFHAFNRNVIYPRLVPQIVLLATVAYASAGLYSGYGGLYGYGGYGYGGYGSGYGLGHGVSAIAPAITYAHAPVATSYANTYKVSSFKPDVIIPGSGLSLRRRMPSRPPARTEKFRFSPAQCDERDNNRAERDSMKTRSEDRRIHDLLIPDDE